MTQVGGGEQDILSPTRHQYGIFRGVIFGDDDMMNLNKWPLFDKPVGLTGSTSFQTLVEVKAKV